MKGGKEFIEREDQYPADLRPSGDDLADARGNADLKITPSGDPNQQYDVRSVFDSRPVNAFDFNVAVSGVAGATPDDVVTAVIFTVPEGYVAIPRLVSYRFMPQYVFSDPYDVTLSMQRSLLDIPHNIDIPVGLNPVGEIDVFFVVDEFQSIGVRINNVPAIPAESETNNVLLKVYGTLLLKRNIPAIFEVANPCGGCGGTIRRSPAPPKQTKPTPPAPPAPPVPAATTPAQPQCPPGYYWAQGKCWPVGRKIRM